MIELSKYDYKQDHIPKTTPCNRRPGHAMTATTITIHNTGNEGSTAVNERGWLTNPANNRTASYHIVIGPETTKKDSPTVTIECIPLNESAWAAGDGSGLKSGNRTSIHIEICESGDYAKTLDSAVSLVAKMLKERGWGVDRLRRHYDWARPSDGYRKICPRLMYDGGKWTGWEQFKAMVQKELNGGVGVASDVSKDHWAANSIAKAIDSGIIKGYADGTFKPNNNVTRAELAVILDRAGLTNVTDRLSKSEKGE